MSVTKSRENLAPIRIEQCTLNKFFPHLPEPKNHSLLIELERRNGLSNRISYTLRMNRECVIYIKETHCLRCKSRLINNGINPRIAILDNGLGRYEFYIHRKRCPKCGEIKPDYSNIAPKFGNYHENYKRRARQHYMDGLMPSQIQRVFKIDFGIKISKTSIVNWINEVAEPLRETLKETPVPSSGYWGYDEIKFDKLSDVSELIIDIKQDLLFAGSLKTLLPYLEFGGDEQLFDALMFVLTPDGLFFPATFYYGASGTALGGWMLKRYQKFPKETYDEFNFSPFDLDKDGLTGLIEAHMFALKKVPVSDFCGIYKHDLGNTLMCVHNSVAIIREFGYDYGEEEVEFVLKYHGYDFEQDKFNSKKMVKKAKERHY